MKLEHWSIVPARRPRDPHASPPASLRGVVFLDHRRRAGTLITTSPIVALIGDTVITAAGSEYQLGDVCPEFAKQCPGARTRRLSTTTLLEGVLK